MTKSQTPIQNVSWMFFTHCCLFECLFVVVVVGSPRPQKKKEGSEKEKQKEMSAWNGRARARDGQRLRGSRRVLEEKE